MKKIKYSEIINERKLNKFKIKAKSYYFIFESLNFISFKLFEKKLLNQYEKILEVLVKEIVK